MSYIFDNHTSKCNKYSAFENIKILPTEHIRIIKPDYIVILAWIYTDKIIRENIEYVKNGGKFITLWPEVSEINKKNLNMFLN